MKLSAALAWIALAASPVGLLFPLPFGVFAMFSALAALFCAWREPAAGSRVKRRGTMAWLGSPRHLGMFALGASCAAVVAGLFLQYLAGRG